MLKIVFLLSLFFAIYWMVRVKKRYVLIMTSGLVLAGLMVLFAPDDFPEYGMYLYIIFSGVVFVYGIISKQKNPEQRFVISLMSLSVILYWVWTDNHWHGNTLLLPVFVLLVGIYALARRIKLKNEVGILLIFAVDSLAILLENWLK